MPLKLRSTFSYQWPFARLNYQDEVGFIGSCFAERVNARMAWHRFKVQPAFFGTLFNPRSIFSLLSNEVTAWFQEEQAVVEKDGHWVHFASHSAIKASNQNELVQKLNEEHQRGQDFLKNGNYLFITLGSMWAYEDVELHRIVANCHKQPQQRFNKVLLDLDTEVTFASDVLEAIWSQNPNLKVIFTVSPVKHLRDGVVENKLSKSLLRVFTSRLAHAFPNQIAYLPVLEWVEEDLRDYRFYENDLAHPNSLAEDYVWEQVVDTVFSDETVALLPEVAILQRNLQKSKLDRKQVLAQVERINSRIGVPFEV